MVSNAQPIKAFSIGRGESEVTVTLWQNEYAEGKFSRSYAITRSFKQEDGNWRKTSSFKIEHLPLILVLLVRAIFSGIQVKEIQPKPVKEELPEECEKVDF